MKLKSFIPTLNLKLIESTELLQNIISNYCPPQNSSSFVPTIVDSSSIITPVEADVLSQGDECSVSEEVTVDQDIEIPMQETSNISLPLNSSVTDANDQHLIEAVRPPETPVIQQLSPSGRPLEFNKLVFSPLSINPVPYDPVNFQPICIDNVIVPSTLFNLASLSPSFSPTPTKCQPPDGNVLHAELMEFKRVLSWKYYFRKLMFDEAASIEEFLQREFANFQKHPWYEKSTAVPPALPPLLEEAFNNVYNLIMQPKNWYKYRPNLSTELRQSIALAKTLPSQDIGIYCQDKSSRICFASLSTTNGKVEQVLSDTSKYKRLRYDRAVPYQSKIRAWYRRYKPVLVSITDDISSFLVPDNVATPHLKVMIKTHKPQCPVRLTFSSVGSTTCNLSTVIDHVYLKPTVNSGLCKRRLADTRDALKFIEKVNDHLWQNNIQEKPTIFAMDVKNFFPSVNQSLALPAISRFLKERNYTASEVHAVLEALKVIRNGNFFKWRDQFFNQISGCALGDPDSCSYSDLALADLLDRMIPACENDLDILLDPFFKIFRDDGLGVLFGNPSLIQDILRFFNQYEPTIQWTIPICSICSKAEATCQHYQCLEFLDCSISWKQVRKDELLIWQFIVQSYSKPTDVHAYLAPSSCTSPHLNAKGVALAKTVGTRLRTIHTNDELLLEDLNRFAGFIIARGYEANSVKYHLAAMANRSREELLNGVKNSSRDFVIPLVSTLHPAITVLTKLTRQEFKGAADLDPVLPFIIPNSALLVTYKKLPNLQLLLCKNDQNALVNYSPHDVPGGYTDTGCRCQVCRISIFSKFVRPPSMPGFSVRIPQTTTCRSGPAIIYHIVCRSGLPQCQYAQYVGRAFTSDNTKAPMCSRWANHKSHPKYGHNFCRLSNHLMTFHKGEDPQKFMSIQVLQSAATLEEIKPLELYWTRKLFSFEPTGLNKREETEFVGENL